VPVRLIRRVAEGNGAPMKVPVVIHEARPGADEFTVVRPSRSLDRAVLVDRDRHLDLHLDAEAAQEVARLWLLAASSPRRLVHLPLRTGHPGPGEPSGGTGAPLDLVLLHHSLQFAPSRWKRVRGRLGPGRPRTMSLPAGALDDVATADAGQGSRRHHRDNRDLFHEHLHADTLFLTGSARVFRDTARLFLDVAREGPDFEPVHRLCPRYCTRLHSAGGFLGRARELHIVYRGRWDEQP
jgi:N-formylglutamate amidohydrolase